MNYFLTQYFVNKIKRNRMKEMYNKETLDGVTKINGKQYNKEMIDRIAEEMDVVRERYMVSQYNERNVDATIDRITDTLNRIESKVDRLIDAVVNVKK